MFISLFLWPSHVACGILVPRPVIEPGPSAVEAQSPDHWTPWNFLYFFHNAYYGKILRFQESKNMEPKSTLISTENEAPLICTVQVRKEFFHLEKVPGGCQPFIDHHSLKKKKKHHSCQHHHPTHFTQSNTHGKNF